MESPAALQAPLLPILKKAEKPEPPQDEPVLKFETIGIWSIMYQVQNRQWSIPGQKILDESRKLWEASPAVFRFLQECYGVAPTLMTAYLAANLWRSAQEATGLYLSSRILDNIQKSISSGHIDETALLISVFQRIFYTLINSIMSSYRKRSLSTLSTRIQYLFEERVIKANLKLDFPTCQEPDVVEKMKKYMGDADRDSPSLGAWNLFDQVIRKVQILTSVVSQLFMLFGILRYQHGGFLFGLICLMKAFFDVFDYETLWDRTAYIWASNPHYLRMRSLVKFVQDAAHRVEIISDVLSDYIQREWLNSRKLLGDTPDDWPSDLKLNQRPISRVFLAGLIEDFPMIFYAIQVYISPKSFSLPSIALMEQASSTLTWTMYELFRDSDSMLQTFRQVKDLYALGEIQNLIKDGELPYPRGLAEQKGSRGMSVTFENVSFSYPRNTTGMEVLKNVSFSIKSGQTVVVVGINGSGKSTLLKLFNRLYEPTSGSISIDGAPLTSFVATDVRRSMAMLYQTYSHFPLSILENIALGRPDMVGSFRNSEDQVKDEKDQVKQAILREAVQEAAVQGGAWELIQQQKKGLDTILHPSIRSWSTCNDDLSPAFKDKMNEVTKKADVSAGQWQRLALSRLFFRAADERVQLVAADEPSASLDPAMEYQLFERLRSLSTAQGKTMIYVTHRFGYLTKHADLILVMHKGELIEQGKHADLLARDGEYAKLFKLQADAFITDEHEPKK